MTNIDSNCGEMAYDRCVRPVSTSAAATAGKDRQSKTAHDLSKWTYAEIRDTINTSSGLLFEHFVEINLNMLFGQVL